MRRDRAKMGAPPNSRRFDAEAPAAHSRDPAAGSRNRVPLREPVYDSFERLTAMRPRGRNDTRRSHRFGSPIMERQGFVDAS